MIKPELPLFPGAPRKNDAIFIYGALQTKPFVFIYEQQKIEVVYGPACGINEEIRVEMCKTDGVPIVGRRNGGGAVVLAPGMVIIIVVGERTSGTSPRNYFDSVNDALINVLSKAGIEGVVRNGISDCSLNDRKILGSSLYLGNNPFLYYYQASLLVNPDLSLFERYLYYPPREPSYRRGRPHREFCTSLTEEGYSLSCQHVKELLTLHLPELLGMERT